MIVYEKSGSQNSDMNHRHALERNTKHLLRQSQLDIKKRDVCVVEVVI
jgi:hypothetical protein